MTKSLSFCLSLPLYHFPVGAGQHVAEIDRREGRGDPEVSATLVTPSNGTRQNDGGKGEDRPGSPTPQQEAGHTAAKEGRFS